MVGDQLTSSKRNVRLLSDPEYLSKERFRADPIIETGMKLSGAGEGMNNSKQEQNLAKLLLPLAVVALATLGLLACRGENTTPNAADTQIQLATSVPSGTVATSVSTTANDEAPILVNDSTSTPSDADALFDAIWRGEVDEIRALVATGADANAVDEDGNPYLLEAVWRGREEVVQVLVSAGADINARDSENNPVLHRAVWPGDAEMVQALVDLGADVNALDANGDPLLHEAVWRGHAEVAQILMVAGADVNAMDADRDPLLHEAVWRGHTVIVSLLIDGGADVNAKDAGGDSMSQEARFREHSDIEEILLATGAME